MYSCHSSSVANSGVDPGDHTGFTLHLSPAPSFASAPDHTPLGERAYASFGVGPADEREAEPQPRCDIMAQTLSDNLLLATDQNEKPSFT